MSLVDLDRVGVRFGARDALTDIDLVITAGERVGLLGPSGAGKSTLLGVIGARLAPTSGTATVLGHDTRTLRGSGARDVRRRIGTIHQDFALTDALRVVHNVNAGRLGAWSTGRALRSLVRPVGRDTVEAALDAVGLTGRIDSPTGELSGGERQRVAVARLLVQAPDLVLADEPAASLDPALGRLVVELLTEVAASDARAVVVSLHDPVMAREHCDRLVGLRDGRIAFDRPAASVTGDDLDVLYAR